MARYTVELSRSQKSEVDIDAESPQAAAMSALSQMNDPEGDYQVDRVVYHNTSWKVISKCCKCRCPIVMGAWFATDDDGNYLCRECSEATE